MTRYAAADRVVLHLQQEAAELVIGFRGGRGACYWRHGESDDVVSTSGENTESEMYGANEIPFPPGAEIDAGTVVDAAEEFATTGVRPQCVRWTSYRAAMQAVPEEGTITPELLRAVLGDVEGER
ncbi:Imm1 family immunity protein [Saccharopolyspora sp. 6V]|uniref:Imm1 family immunity protein n=1 Tax=Saccharopolyspora sp. 6V TaxID=2877239 RepID=UPI001CD7C9AA|nr:Imm1 family immunity protein [Saccharopolyspora sp. 6V]MCA1194230.1 hypothetical protein [Saccharopolyspora sp. 6V]